MATSDDIVFARVVGLGTMNNCVSFKQFLDHLKERGFGKFVFDLSDCEGFDSTFMGILLGLALGRASVVLVNLKIAHRKLLSDVGIHRVVQLCEEPVSLPDVDLKKLESRPVETSSRLGHVLAAHENLVRLDRRNQEKFGAFVAILREELGDGSTL